MDKQLQTKSMFVGNESGNSYQKKKETKTKTEKRVIIYEQQQLAHFVLFLWDARLESPGVAELPSAAPLRATPDSGGS